MAHKMISETSLWSVEPKILYASVGCRSENLSDVFGFPLEFRHFPSKLSPIFKEILSQTNQNLIYLIKNAMTHFQTAKTCQNRVKNICSGCSRPNAGVLPEKIPKHSRKVHFLLNHLYDSRPNGTL